ncbi:MAG: septum site-determining protein MinC [Chloroflexi bacterium]|nr:septum site-determining protein MinC [Chloroflexota bacterium]
MSNGHRGPVLKTGIVQVETRGADVAFVIDDEAPFEAVAGELREYLANMNGLFSKGDITMKVGQRMLARDELSRMKSIIETHSGLTVTRFWCPPESLDSGDLKIEAKPAAKSAVPAVPKQELPAHNEVVIPEPEPEPVEVSSVESVIADLRKRQNKNGARNRNRTEALFIKSTFRSGESVHHDGDVVVLADVNPGAEIEADGDIVVLGALKGMAHAGAAGDTKAVIIALELPATRFQIAKYQGIAPVTARRKGKSSATDPKIAYVRSRSIHVAPFAGRFARYSKGVPYDG